MKYGFGIDLGGTTVKIAYFNQEGQIITKWEIPTVTDNGGSQILPDIAAAVKDFIAKESIDPSTLIGIGIGVPGPVDNTGVVNKCVNLGWGKTDISKILGDLTGMPVRAGNDANVAALGEAWKGCGQGCENMVLATLGTGVGGGIVVGGKVIHGVNGAGGEIGHICINRHETDHCGCGKQGCVEQYCSATGIVRIAEQTLRTSDMDSTLRDIFPLTCKDIFDAGKAGDVLANEILEKVYEYMGRFLSMICCVVDPELVVLGGGVSKAGEPLLEGTKRYFSKYIFHASNTNFALASLGNDAGAYGAFKLVLDEFG